MRREHLEHHRRALRLHQRRLPLRLVALAARPGLLALAGDLGLAQERQRLAQVEVLAGDPLDLLGIAAERGVGTHCDASTMKRDFMSLLRVEVVLGGERHAASGTVLGHRHGRMVELDGYVLDAIPEGPMLFTFHRDEPGVVGKLGTVVGAAGCNISRMQIGQQREQAAALGILNLEGSVDDALLDEVRAIDAVDRACLVR